MRTGDAIQPSVLLLRPPWTQHDRGHRLLIIIGSAPQRHAKPAKRRVNFRRGCCSSSKPYTRLLCDHVKHPVSVYSCCFQSIGSDIPRLLNDDGKTYAFDHRAISGFARGEGAGAIILKPLDAAIRDRDVVRAVIHHSGVNQDGKTNGITVPNGSAQTALIRQVYASAGLDPAECGFSECHGTGTKVGDPIEVNAIREALGQGRTPKNPLFIGSVKSNVGHLEGASGIVSIIKAAMMLEKKMLLPNANFEKANPNINLEQYNMKVSIKNFIDSAQADHLGAHYYKTLATGQEICLGRQLWFRRR